MNEQTHKNAITRPFMIICESSLILTVNEKKTSKKVKTTHYAQIKGMYRK